MYIKFSVLGELGKLSQGKPTQLPAATIAQMAIERIREDERSLQEYEALDELEELYQLCDPRT